MSSPRFANRNRAVFLSFLFVPVALYIGAYLYPLLYSLYLSMHSWNGMTPTWEWVGFQNYIVLFQSQRFWSAIARNLQWLAFYLVVPTAAGLGLAMLLEEKLRGQSVFKAVFFIPFTMTPIAVAAIWKWMYRPNRGVISQFLESTGLSWLDRNWLGDPSIVTFSIMVGALWWTLGFSFLLFFAGLRSIPREYIEASQIDGASPWGVFWNIQFPLLLPSTIVVLGISGVEAMRIFDIVQGMTMGGPFQSSEVLATLVYDTSFARFEMGMGAATATVLMIVASIIVMPYILYTSNRIEDAE